MTDRITATIDHPAIFLAGLATAVVCLFVGAAAGTLCNPPLLRHPGAAALATLAVVIVALAANVSPANAALRSDIASTTAARWPSAVSLIAAAVLLAITWTASALAAARRERSLAERAVRNTGRAIRSVRALGGAEHHVCPHQT